GTCSRPYARADRPTVLVVDALDIVRVLERDRAASRQDDGVSLVPAAAAAGRLEFGDDAAAVAIEHALLGKRAVVAITADVAAPPLLPAAAALDLPTRRPARGRAAAGLGPLPALVMTGRHPRLVGVVAVTRQRVAHELLACAQGGEAAVQAIERSERVAEV